MRDVGICSFAYLRGMNRIATKLTSRGEKAVRSGHPWVYDQSIDKINGEPTTGDLAIIYDQKKNKLMALGLFDMDSPMRIKIISKGPAQINEDFWKEKLTTAFEIRKPLLLSDTNSYRLIHGENDGMPGLIIDVYDKTLVVKIYSLIWLPFIALIYQLLTDIFTPQAIVQRASRKAVTSGNLTDGEVVFGTLENETVIFKEHGISFSANVVHGHKTGFFLDHRHNRKKAGELSMGKTVLDIFSYAGGFSVHAAVGGALEVVSMDISHQALEQAKFNMGLNKTKAQHRILAMDAFKGMEQMVANHELFDVVIVDPPSFAKKAEEVPGAIKSYTRLAQLAAQLVAPNGHLVLASCSSRVQADQFFDACEKGILKSRRKLSLYEKTFHDIDHPIGFEEGAYLKCGYYYS